MKDTKEAKDITQCVHINKTQYDKWDRLREAQRVFKELGIKYDAYNNELHWILEHNDEEIHYWATSGKWWLPESNHRSTEDERYLSGLLTYMNYSYQEWE